MVQVWESGENSPNESESEYDQLSTSSTASMLLLLSLGGRSSLNLESPKVEY